MRQISCPVNIELREGVQEGLVQKELVNNRPSSATMSKAGVLTTGSPVAPVCSHDWSSEIIKRILGRPGSVFSTHPVITNSKDTKRMFKNGRNKKTGIPSPPKTLKSNNNRKTPNRGRNETLFWMGTEFKNGRSLCSSFGEGHR